MLTITNFLTKRGLYHKAFTYTKRYWGFTDEEAIVFYRENDDALAFSGFFDFEKTHEGLLYWRAVADEYKKKKDKKDNNLFKIVKRWFTKK